MAQENFDISFQKRMLGVFFHSPDVFFRCQDIIKPKYFDNPYRKVVDIMLKHAEKYKRLPLINDVVVEVKLLEQQQFQISPAPCGDEQQTAAFLDKIERFCRYKEIEGVIYNGPELLEKGDYGALEKQIKDAMLISLHRDLGLDYFESPRERLLQVIDNRNMISTGWKAVDSALFGGMSRKELNIFAGNCVTGDTKVKIAIKRKNITTTKYLYKKEEVNVIGIVDIKTLVNRAPKDYLIEVPGGYSEIEDYIENAETDVVEIKTQAGRKIKCSINHMFLDEYNQWVIPANIPEYSKIFVKGGLDTVISVKPCGKEKVYDLTINNFHHWYYGNDIINHNSGMGKSLFLQNLTCNWLMQKLNVVYISLELSELLISMRLDAMITNISTKELFKNLDRVENTIMVKKYNMGKLKIKYFPSGTTVNTIAAYMKELETKEGIKYDVLIVDYLDLMYPNSKRIDASNLFIKDKFVTEELRSYVVEKNMLCATASQLNRSAIHGVEHDQSMIAGGISKINTADNVMTIFTTDAMRARGEYRLQFIKTRSSAGVGKKIPLGFDINTLRITDAPNSNDYSDDDNNQEENEELIEDTYQNDYGEENPIQTSHQFESISNMIKQSNKKPTITQSRQRNAFRFEDEHDETPKKKLNDLVSKVNTRKSNRKNIEDISNNDEEDQQDSKSIYFESPETKDKIIELLGKIKTKPNIMEDDDSDQ